jgi:hypothetical protein
MAIANTATVSTPNDSTTADDAASAVPLSLQSEEYVIRGSGARNSSAL